MTPEGIYCGTCSHAFRSSRALTQHKRVVHQGYPGFQRRSGAALGESANGTELPRVPGVNPPRTTPPFHGGKMEFGHTHPSGDGPHQHEASGGIVFERAAEPSEERWAKVRTRGSPESADLPGPPAQTQAALNEDGLPPITSDKTAEFAEVMEREVALFVASVPEVERGSLFRIGDNDYEVVEGESGEPDLRYRAFPKGEKTDARAGHLLRFEGEIFEIVDVGPSFDEWFGATILRKLSEKEVRARYLRDLLTRFDAASDDEPIETAEAETASVPPEEGGR